MRFRIVDSIYFLLISISLAGCAQTLEPSETAVALSPTTTPTQMATPMTSMSPALILSSAIGESLKVITFDKALQPIHLFAGSADYLSPGDCLIYSISYMDNRFIIKSFDYEGNPTGSRIVTLADSGAHLIHSLSPSPNGERIAYKETSGEYGRAFEDGEIQDVRVIKTTGSEPQTPIDVSEKSGAKWNNLTWLPDGRYLAYIDLDQKSIHQVFLFDPVTKTRTQITQLERDYAITELEWSFDSQVLAYVFSDLIKNQSGEYFANSQVGFETLSGVDETNSTLPLSGADEIQVIWGHGRNLLILARNITEQSSTLLWYDIESQKITRTIESSIFASDWAIYSAFPLDEELTTIGLLGRSVYVLDVPGGTYSTIENQGTADWFLTGFPSVLRNPAGGYRPADCLVK